MNQFPQETAVDAVVVRNQEMHELWRQEGCEGASGNALSLRADEKAGAFRGAPA